MQPAWGQEDVAEEVPALEVPARAWAVTDLTTGEYLSGSAASEELPMASTTKVMGALVAPETDLDEEVTVSEEAAAFAVPAYSNVGLLPGDVLSARELLMASMISSGDDASYALAEHVGGGSVERFVGMMKVVVKVDGRVVGASPLVARRGYVEASLWERVWYTVGGVFA